MLSLVVILCLIVGTFAQSMVYGRCPTPHGERINLTRYAGLWYEYARSRDIWDDTGKCSKYYWDKPISGISLLRSTEISKLTGRAATNYGRGFLVGSNRKGIEMHFPIVGNQYKEFWVLKTDYNNYSIVWTCMEFGTQHSASAWAFTRQPSPSINMEKVMLNAFARHGILMPDMIKIDHHNCP